MRLRPVHRPVGAPDQLVAVSPARPTATPTLTPMVSGPPGPRKRPPHSATTCATSWPTATSSGSGQDDELVAAEPGDQFPRPGQADQPGGGLGEDAVADGVPVLVVDPLELVQVAEEQRATRPAALQTTVSASTAPPGPRCRSAGRSALACGAVPPGCGRR